MPQQISIADVRAKYPQYNNLSDEQLAQGLHKKFYSQMPYEQFTQSIGLSTEPTWQEKAKGFGEATDTIISSMVAEPLAGLAGMARGAYNQSADTGLLGMMGVEPSDISASEQVAQTREALTIQPRTQEGQENIQAVGEFVEPVATTFQEAEQGLGDFVFEKTGSPALAAAATTIPTLATEVLGIAAGKGIVKSSQHLKKQREAGLIARDLDDALPTKEDLFDLGSKLYKEVDEAGASVKSKRYTDLVNRIEEKAIKAGFNKTLTPKSAAVIDEMRTISDVDVPLSQIDTFRKQAGAPAGDLTNPTDSSIGVLIRSEIDDLLDNAHAGTVKYIGDNPKELSKKLKTARDVWGRARKSEIIEEAFTKADLARSGFENGLRQEFARLLRNKKTRKMFSKDEIAAIKAVESGDSSSNLAKLIGKFGFSGGKAANMTGGSIGVALGGAASGVGSAVIIPMIGGVSRSFAERLTRNGANFADKVIRAGSDADKIVKAYYKFTPKAQRSASELSELLMNKEIDYSSIKGDELIKEAAKLAKIRKGQIAGATAGAMTPKEETSENQ